MTDNVEDILKRIHVMFAKCESYLNSPDRVVVSKKEMFELLEELNEAMYDVLDKYEATARSRERAKLEMDKHAAEIVAEARRSAEEVNAASLMYTDSMLDEVKEAVRETEEKLRKDFEELLGQFSAKCDYIEQNKKEITEQLKELHDGERYLKTLQEERRKEQAAGDDGEDGDEGQDSAAKKAEIVVKVYKPGENAGLTVFNKTRGPKKTREEKQQMLEELRRRGDAAAEAAPALDKSAGSADKPLKPNYSPDDFDLDREYYEWKDEAQGTETERRPAKKKWLDGVLGRSKPGTK